ILTDLDKSIIDLPANEEEDSSYEKHCRASEVSGLERKEKLDNFCEKNEFLMPFYAEHTFEVDFLMSGNSYEYVEALGEIISSKQLSINRRISWKMNLSQLPEWKSYDWLKRKEKAGWHWSLQIT